MLKIINLLDPKYREQYPEQYTHYKAEDRYYMGIHEACILSKLIPWDVFIFSKYMISYGAKEQAYTSHQLSLEDAKDILKQVSPYILDVVNESW